MKITLDQDTLAKAVINHLRSVGVQSDILGVDFRYTRVPYTVFAEVELAEAQAMKPPRPHKPAAEPLALPVAEEPVTPEVLVPMVDPSTLPIEEPAVQEPPPESPAAPLFGGE